MTTVSESVVEKVERVKPSQTNSYGNAHGGELVKLMDEIAAISAMRVALEKCVTARISEVNFHTPVIQGDVVKLTAYVYETGETSLEVYVKVDKESMDGSTVEATTAKFTMVAIDEDGNPVEAGNVSVESDRDEELLSSAQSRSQ